MPLDAFSLARRLRAGETVYSAWCGLPEPLVCEVIAREGFSAVTLDMQHGMWDEASALQAIANIHLAGAAPVVRVPLWQNALISRMLDFGAEGIIAPMINGEAEARALCAGREISAGRRALDRRASRRHARARAGPEALYRRCQCRTRSPSP